LVPNVAKFGPVISIRSLDKKSSKNVFIVGKKPACVNGTDPFLLLMLP
jgi:hypothetical protein